MRECFLNGYGPCGGGISAEHYISRTVLEAGSADGTARIGGLPWQLANTLQSFGIGALVSNILCANHNSRLSPLDTVGGELIRVLNAIDKQPQSLSAVTKFDGLLVERWLLKVICGMSAGVRWNNGTVPDSWKTLLVGGPWPTSWGLYVPIPTGSQVLVNEFSVESKVHPRTRAVLTAAFRVAGVHFSLLLAVPDNPAAWGHYRPRGVIFETAVGERAVELIWPDASEVAVIYSRIGSTAARPPQWAPWNE